MTTRFMLALYLAAAGLSAASIPVGNSSFESAVLPYPGVGPYSQIILSGSQPTAGTLDSWIGTGAPSANSLTGGFKPDGGVSNWSVKWFDGNNVAYLLALSPGTEVTLSQMLAATLLVDTTYTLTVDVGRRADPARQINYAIQLFAGATMLGSASNLALGLDSSGTDSLTYNSPAGSPLAGAPLEIRFVTQNITGVPTDSYFDNVRLEAIGGSSVPEPAAGLLTTVAVFIGITLRKSRAGSRQTGR